jgi:hypothetical protein
MMTATIQMKSASSHMRPCSQRLRAKIVTPKVRFDNEKNNPDWQDERCPRKRFACYRMYSVCRFFRYDPSVFSAQQINHATQNVYQEECSVYCSWSFGPRHHTPHQSGFMQRGLSFCGRIGEFSVSCWCNLAREVSILG